MIHGIGGAHGPRHAQQTGLREFQRLASGKRLNSAADGAADLATVQQFLAIEAGAAQGQRNLSDGQSVARLAEGALGSSAELVGRMQELAVQAGNGTLNDADRATIQQEYDQLAAEVDRISASTQFNGQNLLDGSAGGAGAINLADGSNGDAVKLDIGDHSSASLGLRDLDLSNPSSLDAIGRARDAISSSRARLGTADRRLGHHIENLRGTSENTAAARSRIQDADYAKETSNLTKSQILEQSQLALRVNNKVQSEMVLRLLS